MLHGQKADYKTVYINSGFFLYTQRKALCSRIVAMITVFGIVQREGPFPLLHFSNMRPLTLSKLLNISVP